MEEQFDWTPSPPSSPLTPPSPVSPLFDDSPSALSSYSSSPPAHQTVLDFQGLPITVSASLSPADASLVRSSIDAYMAQVFVYGDSWHVISQAVAVDSHCLLALVLMADYLIANESFALAVQYLARARELLQLSGGAHSPHTQRERQYVRAWNEWVKGKTHALVTLTELIAAHPSDLFAVKKAQLIAFLQGDFPRMLSIVRQPTVAAACGSRPYYQGMLAFALEENGEVDEAEAAGRRGVAVDAGDVWSYHAVAHCLLQRGRLREGIAWMERHCHRWELCMSFMYTHAWFHTALFYLEDGQLSRVQHCYDHHVWRPPSAPSPPCAHTDSAPAPLSLPPTASAHRGVPIPADSPSVFVPFLHADRGKLEDQLNALILLWKWDLRVTGVWAGGGGRGDEFDERYREIVKHVAFPPSSCLGLFGLLLLHAAVRAGEREKAKGLLAQITAKVQAMGDDGSAGRRRAKHVAIFLPVANAIFTADTDASSKGQEAAYQLAAPVMTTYHRYLHRQERKHQRKGEAGAAVEGAVGEGAGLTGSAPWSAVSFPFSGRHVLQVIVGSGEQRSVLTDFWLQLLYDSGRFAECEEEARQWLRDRRGTEGCRSWQRVVDECQRRRLSARDPAVQGTALQ